MKFVYRILSAAILFFCLHTIVLGIPEAANTAEDHPNVIFFATDDLNTWINPLGYSQALTPNLDRLAAMGISFTNAHAPAAFCAPSRSAVFSGLHASSTGCYEDELYFYDMPDLVSLQVAFSQAGYKAYGAGKLYHHRAGSIDMRGWEKYFSRSQEIRDWGYEMGYRGSDVPFPDPHPYSPYYTDPRSPYYLEPGEQIDAGGFLEWGPIAKDKAELIPDAVRTNWVCDLLEQEHTDPFFIALGLYSPHFPNYAPQEFFDIYDRDSIIVPYLKADDLDDLPDHIRNRMTARLIKQQTLEDVDAVEDAIIGYLAAVSFADAMLGRVLDALEASAYKDNTLIIFWSDQGYHHGEKGQWGKHTLWQETSHVPLIFAGQGIPKNQKVAATVSLIDLYPTLIELCKLPEQHQMDGVSLVPALNNPAEAVDRNVLMTYMERGGYASINSDWRYIQYHDGSEELYDLKDDPNEWYNLATDESYRSIMDEMQQTAPAEFHELATQRNTLKLVIDGDSYYWESKDGSKPASFISASVTFSNPISEIDVSFLKEANPENEAYTEQQIKANKDCRYIPENKFGYFNVDDALFHSGDNELSFDITYLDDTNSSFELHYNSSGSATQSIVIAKTSTNKWLTKTVMLTDAALNNQLNHQSDIRIAGEVYVRMLRVRKPMPSDVSLVFADQIIGNGIEFVVGTNPDKETYTEQATIGDNYCRLIPTTDKTKYGYFRVDDALIKPGDNKLTFEITYFDQGTSPIMIQYNGTNADYEKAELTRTNTETWMTRSFTVNDAAFDNKQNSQGDFRIRGEAYIRRVAIRKEGTGPSAIRQSHQSDYNVKLGINQGILRISIPEAFVGAELNIYNLMGQVIYRSKISQTEEDFHVAANSNVYIVTIRSGSAIVSKKILAL